MKSRPSKIHWRPNRQPETVCGRTVYYSGRQLVNYAEFWVEYVDCHLCLHRLGRYMPLPKLAEHQAAQRMRAEAWKNGAQRIMEQLQGT